MKPRRKKYDPRPAPPAPSARVYLTTKDLGLVVVTPEDSERRCHYARGRDLRSLMGIERKLFDAIALCRGLCTGAVEEAIPEGRRTCMTCAAIASGLSSGRLIDVDGNIREACDVQPVTNDQKEKAS